jgi:hypothetical protein
MPRREAWIFGTLYCGIRSSFSFRNSAEFRAISDGNLEVRNTGRNPYRRDSVDSLRHIPVPPSTSTEPRQDMRTLSPALKPYAPPPHQHCITFH